MFNNIARKVVSLYCRFMWQDGYEWCRAVQPVFVGEATEFLSERGLLSREQSIEQLARKWPSYVERLFDSSSPERFYLGWQEDVGASNIAANILDQLSRPYLASVLIRQFGPNHEFRGALLDFGCGTAALSLSWQISFAAKCDLILSDVENLAREFVRFYVDRHPDFKVGLVDVDLRGIHNNSIDGVMCIHVLEHLPNPSATLRLLDAKLKSGGILVLEVPWGGYPEHLKESPTDWTEKGGEELLRVGYDLLRKMNPAIPLSGVYQKK